MVEQSVGERHAHGDAQGDGRPAHAVEEPEHRPERDPEGSAKHARKPISERHRERVVRDAEGAEQPGTSAGQQSENRCTEDGRPHRRPGGLRGARIAATTLCLRHQGLHRQADAAEQQYEHQNREVNCPHRGDGRR